METYKDILSPPILTFDQWPELAPPGQSHTHSSRGYSCSRSCRRESQHSHCRGCCPTSSCTHLQDNFINTTPAWLGKYSQVALNPEGFPEERYSCNLLHLKQALCHLWPPAIFSSAANTVLAQAGHCPDISEDFLYIPGLVLELCCEEQCSVLTVSSLLCLHYFWVGLALHVFQNVQLSHKAAEPFRCGGNISGDESCKHFSRLI